MRWALALAVIVGAAWLQVSWFGHVRPLGVIPNLVLVAVVLVSLWLNATTALAAAVLGGLLLDLASGSDFGLRMAFFLVIALGIVAARQVGLQADSVLTGLLFVVVGSLLYDTAVLATVRAPFSNIVVYRMGAGAVDVLIAAFLCYVARGNLQSRGQKEFERRLWR